jgi:hypothetical protein
MNNWHIFFIPGKNPKPLPEQHQPTDLSPKGIPVLLPDFANHCLSVPGHSHSIVNEPRKFSTDAGLPVVTPDNTMKNTMIRSY